MYMDTLFHFFGLVLFYSSSVLFTLRALFYIYYITVLFIVLFYL